MSMYAVIVDDNEDDREVMEGVFPTGRVQTTVTYDSQRDFEDFLDSIGRHDYENVPALFILDVRLEAYDSGLQLLSKIKRRKRLKRIPCLIVSGGDEEEDIETAYRRGATVYLDKGGDFARDLSRAVRGILSGRIQGDIVKFLTERGL